jgi:SOS response regulatory protein OraA/RecX
MTQKTSIQDIIDKFDSMTEEQRQKLARKLLTRHLEMEAEFAKQAEKTKITSEFLNREYTI